MWTNALMCSEEPTNTISLGVPFHVECEYTHLALSFHNVTHLYISHLEEEGQTAQ